MSDLIFNDLKKRGRYRNPHISNTRRKLFHILLWQLGYYNEYMPLPQVPDAFRYPNPQAKLKRSEPKAVWLGHCTFLLEVGGVHFLTDPVWSDRCSPLKYLGPKRKHDSPLPLEGLPQIDFVLISHNHYDHLDKKAVLKLHKLFPHIHWIVPEGVRKLLAKWGIIRVLELSWWEQRQMRLQPVAPFTVEITSVPAQHFSGRKVLDYNKSLWTGYVISLFKDKKLYKRFYFVGDTGYNEVDFKNIGKMFGSIDLSMIPIGTYIPRKFMSPVHIEPKQSVEIHKEAGSKLSIAMHWKTFRLSSEPLHQPPYDLYLALQDAAIDPSKFRVLEPGQIINW